MLKSNAQCSRAICHDWHRCRVYTKTLSTTITAAATAGLVEMILFFGKNEGCNCLIVVYLGLTRKKSILLVSRSKHSSQLEVVSCALFFALVTFLPLVNSLVCLSRKPVPNWDHNIRCAMTFSPQNWSVQSFQQTSPALRIDVVCRSSPN